MEVAEITSKNQKLYDNLIKSKRVTADQIGDYDTFNTMLADSTNAIKLHSNLLNKVGFKEDEIGNQEDFLGNIDPIKPQYEDPNYNPADTIPGEVRNTAPARYPQAPEEGDQHWTDKNGVEHTAPYKAQKEKPSTWDDISSGLGVVGSIAGGIPSMAAAGAGKLIGELAKGTKFWDTWVGDAIEAFGSGTADVASNVGALANLPMRSYLNHKAKEEGVTDEERKIFVDTAIQSMPSSRDFETLKISAKKEAEKLSKLSDRYDGKDFAELWKQGDYGAVAGDIFLQGAKSLPYMVMAMAGGGGGLVAIGATSAAGKYEQLDNPELPEIFTEKQKKDFIAQKNMGEVQKLFNAALSGTSEAVTELIGSVPMGKYVGRLIAQKGAPAAQQALQKGFSGWLNKLYDRYGLVLGPVGEGLEEVANTYATNTIDYATGANTEFNLTEGAAKSFVYGMGGGMYGTGAALGVKGYNYLNRQQTGSPGSTPIVPGITQPAPNTPTANQTQPVAQPVAPLNPRSQAEQDLRTFHREHADKDTGMLRKIDQVTPEGEPNKSWFVTKEVDGGEGNQFYIVEDGQGGHESLTRQQVAQNEEQINEISEDDYVATMMGEFDQSQQAQELAGQNQMVYNGQKLSRVPDGGGLGDKTELWDDGNGQFVEVPNEDVAAWEKAKQTNPTTTPNMVTRTYGKTQVTGTKEGDNIVVTDPMGMDQANTLKQEVERTTGGKATVNATLIPNEDTSLPDSYQVSIVPYVQGAQNTEITPENTGIQPKNEAVTAVPNKPIYPLDKEGNPDLDKMDEEQTFNFNKETFGEETAIADLQGDIKIVTDKITTAEKKLDKADTKTKIKTRLEIKALSDQKAKLEGLIPATSAVKAPVPEATTPSGAPVQSAGENTNSDIAYHGTPYDYESFDVNRIGTGEGASMRGKGMYFMRSKKYAPFFANINSEDAPIHIGRGGDNVDKSTVNPKILTVAGINSLNLKKGSSRDIKLWAKSQEQDVQNGYDGYETDRDEITVFPESIYKLKIQGKNTIEEFITNNNEVDFREWTTNKERSGAFKTSAGELVNNLQPNEENVNQNNGQLIDNQQGLNIEGSQKLQESKPLQTVTGSNEIDKQISGQEINLNPTEEQKKVGNYKKAHITVQGMNISVENPIGSVRRGKDEDGKAWEHVMKSHYGYFKQTEGKDGDHIDTFIGSNPESRWIFVVDQIKPKTGEFDESKVMTGYNSLDEAKQAYLENYSKDWKGLQAITAVDVEQFKKWLNDGKKQHKPFADYKESEPLLTENYDQQGKVTEVSPVNQPAGEQGPVTGDSGVKGKGKGEKRKKGISKIQKQAYDLETSPTDVRAIVLKHFIGGGKINSLALQELFGNKAGKSVESERRARFTWVSREGQSISEIAHSLWENHGFDQNGEALPDMTDQDFREAIEEVIGSYSSPVKMANDLVKTHKGKESEFTDEQIAEMEADNENQNEEVQNNAENISGEIEQNPNLITIFGSDIDNISFYGNDEGQSIEGDQGNILEGEEKPVAGIGGIIGEDQGDKGSQQPEGNKIPEPVPQGEYGALSEADRRMAEITDAIRRSSAASIRDAQADKRTVSGEEERELENRAAEKYAKENNIWLSFDKVNSLGTTFPSGNENNVYYNDGYLYKVNNLFNSKTIPLFLDRILIHNQLFPQTTYELSGFTGFNGRDVYPILKQKHIETNDFASPEEIADYMGSLGFKKTSETSFTNGQYTVSDLFPRNVLKDKNGDIYVVDAEFKEDIPAPIKEPIKPLMDVLQEGKDVVRDRISKNAAEATLKEVQEKGTIRVADPVAIAENIKKHTGIDVEVNNESGTISLKENHGQPVTWKLDDVNYQYAVNAYRAISFDPEKRAKSEQQGFVDDIDNLHSTLSAIAKSPEQITVMWNQLARYKDGYLSHLNAVLSAKGRTMSSMITGPAKFPVRSNEKKLETEHKRNTEFVEWSDKTEKAAIKAVKEAAPQAQKDDEKWQSIKKHIDSSLASIIAIDRGEKGMSRPLFVNSISGFIKRMAANGQVEDVKQALDYIKEVQEKLTKPIFAANNSVWQLAETVQPKEDLTNKETETIGKYKGLTIENNHSGERVQLMFDSKPSGEVIATLKSKGFHWSPSQGAWQRKSTRDGIYAAESIADSYYEKIETFDDYFKSLQADKIRSYQNKEVAKQDYYLKALRGLYEKESKADQFGSGINKSLSDINEGIMRNLGKTIKDQSIFSYVNKKISELFNKAQEEGKVISQDVIDTKEKNGNAAMFSIIGEKGAANVEGLIDNLTIAKAMAESGKDKETIFLATGWEKFKDGWKYDLPDGELLKTFDEIKNLEAKDEYFTNDIPLNELLGSKELFNAYPELKNYKVRFYNYGTNIEGGQPEAYSSSEGTIIGVGLGNGESIKSLPVLLSGRKGNRANIEGGAYDRNSVLSLLLHETQHIIQGLAGFGRGSDSKDSWSRAFEEKKSFFKEMGWFTDQSEETINQLAKQHVLRDTGEVNVDRAGFKLYKRAAGEVEARNAQTRLDLTPEQRREQLISATEDVAEDQKIYLMDAIDRAYSIGRSAEDMISSAENVINTVNESSNYQDDIVLMSAVEVSLDLDKRGIVLNDTKGLDSDMWDGVTINGKIYIHPSITRNRNRVIQVTMHEKVHAYFNRNFPNKHDKILFFNQAYSEIGESEIKRVLPNYYMSLEKWEQAEEYFAHIMEYVTKSIQLNTNEPANQVLQNFLQLLPDNSVKDVIFDVVNDITDLNKLQNDINTFNREDSGNRSQQPSGTRQKGNDQIDKRGDQANGSTEGTLSFGNKGVGRNPREGGISNELASSIQKSGGELRQGTQGNTEEGAVGLTELHENSSIGGVSSGLGQGRLLSGDRGGRTTESQMGENKERPTAGTTRRTTIPLSDFITSTKESVQARRAIPPIINYAVRQPLMDYLADAKNAVLNRSNKFEVVHRDVERLKALHKKALDEGDYTLAASIFRKLTDAQNAVPPTSVNADVENNLRKAYGIKGEPILDKLKRWWGEVKETAQHFKHITEAEFPSVYNKLRLFEAIPDRAKKEAYEQIAAIIRPIAKDKAAFESFERHIVLQDLVHDINNGLFDGKELPWGYNSIAEIKQDATNMRVYLIRNPAVQKAAKDRNVMMGKIKQQLVANNLLGDNANDDYFHHQVLAYMELRLRPDVGVSSKDVRVHKKGWQRSRTGSMAAYNTNYLESEFEVLAQSLEMFEIKGLLTKIGKEVNIMPSLVEKSNKENYDIAQFNLTVTDKKDEKKYTSWRDFIPEGYRPWFPKQGTNAYKAATMAEKAVQNILNDPNSPNVADLLAEAEGSMWVIPEKVADQMNAMKNPEKEMMFPASLRFLTGKWKQWILLNPYSALKYNFNNMSGDLDVVMAYSPNILKPEYAKAATAEAWAELHGKGMSQDMKEALEHGIITSGLSIQEIPDINQQSLFRSLTRGTTNPFAKYWDTVTSYTQFRENVLRLSAYKYFKDQLGKGKNLYAASDKKAIDALTDTNEKAGKLARELLGDYGNLSQGGQWLRSHSFPFWSWVEINSPRYYRLLKNTQYEEGPATGTVGRVVGVGAKKTAVNVGLFAVKAMLLMGLVTLWNRLMWPDEDDELTQNGNRKLNLIVGRREDGSVMTIKVQGAFSDMLSFLGLEDAPGDIEDIAKGKKSIGKEAKEAGNAFFNKFAQGAMPLTKTMFEVAARKSFYPDILNPRPVRDRWEQGLKIIKGDKIYNYLTRKPMRAFGKEVSGLLVYDNDPGEAAYYATSQNIRNFLKDNDKEMLSGEATDRSNALYYYKQSIKFKDKEKEEFWFEKYKELGGTAKGIHASIDRLKPISALPLNMRKKWWDSLDVEDKEVFNMANEWYIRTYINR